MRTPGCARRIDQKTTRAHEVRSPRVNDFSLPPGKDTKSRCLHPRKTPGSNQGAGTGRALFASGCFYHPWKQDRLPSPHPRVPVPLPHQPGITSLTDLRLRLPGVVDRLSRPADVTPPDLRPHPHKLPVVEYPGERPHLHHRPFSLLKTVVAEVLLPRPPPERRRRPPPADMTGPVLCRREGDVIIRVDRRVTAVAVDEQSRIWRYFRIIVPGLSDSTSRNRGVLGLPGRGDTRGGTTPIPQVTAGFSRVTAGAVDEQNPRCLQETGSPRAGDRALPPGGPPGEQGGAPRDRGYDIRAAHEKKPFPVTPEQGLANVRVCEAIYRSLAA